MAFPKIKLCWRRSPLDADWHLGLFGTYSRAGGTSRLRGVIISLRSLFAWLGVLAVFAYFAGGAALWFWLDRRPYNQVTYTDLILPTRWSGIEQLRGKALIAEAKDDLKARKWGEGIQKMRVGIARYPEEREGRLLLADMFVAMKARKLAIDIYNGGLDHGYPGRDYMEAVFKSAVQSENYDWALAVCDRALAMVDAKSGATDRRWLMQRKLAFLLSSGRSDEALQLAEKEGESWSPAVCEFRVLALLQEGEFSEALLFLQEWSDRVGSKTDAQILRLQVRALREAGDVPRMEAALEALRQLAPTDPRPYVYGIVQRLLAGESTDAGYDGYLLRFGSRSQNLLLLAAPLAEIGNRDMLERLVAHAEQQGFDREPFRRYLLQVLMQKGEWRQAEALFGELKGSDGKDVSNTWYQITNAQIQAALDSADGAQSNLVSLVRGRMFTVSFYKELIAGMRLAGRPSTARQIITFAQGVYPQNDTIEAWRKELDEELAAAEAAKPMIVISSPESTAPTVTSPARAEVNEKTFMASLDKLIEAGDYRGALNQINEARTAKPAWLPSRSVELDRAEVRLYGREGDRLGMRSATRMYLTGDRLRSAQVIEIARELKTAGQTEDAVFLLKELLAKVPDYAIAKKLLAEWSPPPTGKTP